MLCMPVQPSQWSDSVPAWFTPAATVALLKQVVNLLTSYVKDT